MIQFSFKSLQFFIYIIDANQFVMAVSPAAAISPSEMINNYIYIYV